MYKNQIFEMVSKEYKQFVFTDDVVIITTQEFSDIDKILFQVQKQQRQTVGIGEIIKIKDIINIKLDEIKREFTIKYYHTNEKLYFDIQLEDFEKSEAILDELAALRPLKKREIKVTKLKLIFEVILAIGFVTALISWLLYLLNTDATFRRGGASRVKIGKLIIYLIQEFLHFIGPIGTTILCIIIAVLGIFYCYSLFRFPERGIVYESTGIIPKKV